METFTITHYEEDEVKKHLRTYYQKVKETEYEDSKFLIGIKLIKDWERFAISDFLQFKLSQFKDIKKRKFNPVWISDNIVIKLYYFKDKFNNAIKMQNLLYENNLGCKLIETWTNPNFPEFFTISEFGGIDIMTKYKTGVNSKGRNWKNPNIPENIHDQIMSLLKKLKELGYQHNDANDCNFVEDENGIVKIIDYESIAPLDDSILYNV